MIHYRPNLSYCKILEYTFAILGREHSLKNDHKEIEDELRQKTGAHLFDRTKRIQKINIRHPNYSMLRHCE